MNPPLSARPNHSALRSPRFDDIKYSPESGRPHCDALKRMRINHEERKNTKEDQKNLRVLPFFVVDSLRSNEKKLLRPRRQPFVILVHQPAVSRRRFALV